MNFPVVTEACPPAMLRTSWAATDFDVLRSVYKGNSSRVLMAVDRVSGCVVALKQYAKCKLSVLNDFQVRREVALHKSLRHPNIIALYAAFEDEDYITLVQEWAGVGDVLCFAFKQRGHKLSEEDARRLVLLPFLSAVTYLHGLGIMHRDIKPENMLLDENLSLKLADFGLSINLREERPVTRAGTLDYMSPEVLRCPNKTLPSENKDNEKLWYSSNIDTWAAGVLAFELVTGDPPFKCDSRADTYHSIMNYHPKQPQGMSDSCWDFITWCLEKDASKRPECSQLLSHPFITSRALNSSAMRSKEAPVNMRRLYACQIEADAPVHDTASVLSPKAAAASSGIGLASAVLSPISAPRSVVSVTFPLCTGPAYPGGTGVQSTVQPPHLRQAIVRCGSLHVLNPTLEQNVPSPSALASKIASLPMISADVKRSHSAVDLSKLDQSPASGKSEVDLKQSAFGRLISHKSMMRSFVRSPLAGLKPLSKIGDWY